MHIKKESLGLKHDLFTYLPEDLVKGHLLLQSSLAILFALLWLWRIGVVGLRRSLMLLPPPRTLPIPLLKIVHPSDQIPPLVLTPTPTSLPLLLHHQQLILQAYIQHPLPLLISTTSSPILPLLLNRNSVTSTILYIVGILISLYYFL